MKKSTFNLGLTEFVLRFLLRTKSGTDCVLECHSGLGPKKVKARMGTIKENVI